MASALQPRDISVPVVFHRDYANDLPKKEKIESKLIQQCLRVTQVALPFLSLYTPLGRPMSIVLGATRVISTSAEMIAAISDKKGAKTIGRTALDVAIATTALACSILAHPLGMIVTTAHDMIVDVVQLTQAIEAKDYQIAAGIGLRLINNAMYLGCFFAGSLEWSIASIGMQIVLGLYNSCDEFKQGHYLEGFGHLAMAGIRGKQMHSQVQALQARTIFAKCLATQKSSIKANEEDQKFIEKVQMLLKTDPTTLDLSASHVTDAQMILLAQILPSSNVKILNLSCNGFEYIGMLALAQALPHTQITHLDLSGTNGCALEKLIEILPQTQIETLDLSDAGVQGKALDSLIEVLPETKITELNLRDNDIDNDGFAMLMITLPETKVRALNLSANDFHMDDQEICDCLSYGIAQGRLERLDLSDNDIGDLGVCALAHVLEFSEIQELNLSDCMITAKGIQRLAPQLPFSQIRSLDLSTNYLGNEGLSALSQVMPSCNIEKLDLAFDQLQFDGQALDIFKNALIQSKVADLSFGFNEIGIDGAKTFAEILEKGHLERLDLRCDRSIGPEGAVIIAGALKHSQLKELVFDSNNIQDKGCIAIARALPFSKIEWINLGLNQITDASVPALAEAIQPPLKYMQLEYNQLNQTSRQELISKGRVANISVLCNDSDETVFANSMKFANTQDIHDPQAYANEWIAERKLPPYSKLGLDPSGNIVIRWDDLYWNYQGEPFRKLFGTLYPTIYKPDLGGMINHVKATLKTNASSRILQITYIESLWEWSEEIPRPYGEKTISFPEISIEFSDITPAKKV